MKTITRCTVPGQYPVTVEQYGATKRFRVTYGQQITRGLDYEGAAREYGLCVFHALACAGRIEDSGGQS